MERAAAGRHRLQPIVWSLRTEGRMDRTVAPRTPRTVARPARRGLDRRTTGDRRPLADARRLVRTLAGMPCLHTTLARIPIVVQLSPFIQPRSNRKFDNIEMLVVNAAVLSYII